MDSLSWETHEYEYQEKTTDWYFAVGIIAVTLSAVAIIFNNILFAVFIILAAVTLSIYSAKHPPYLKVEINKRGLSINEVMYPFATLESFWVNTEHPPTMLIVKSKKFFVPLITVPINGIHPEDIREHLMNHLNEVEHLEPLGQKIMERLGF